MIYLTLYPAVTDRALVPCSPLALAIDEDGSILCGEKIVGWYDNEIGDVRLEEGFIRERFTSREGVLGISNATVTRDVTVS